MQTLRDFGSLEPPGHLKIISKHLHYESGIYERNLRFEFHYYLVFNNKVGSKALIKFYAIKDNCPRHLPFNLQSSFSLTHVPKQPHKLIPVIQAPSPYVSETPHQQLS